MNCLCCGKTLNNGGIDGWHKKCIKKFFGTNEIPEIDINKSIIEKIALEATTKGYTVTGVQKKLSLHLFSEKTKARLTMVNYPTGFILKPQVDEFEALPEAEQLVMCMADIVGIVTVPHALIQNNGSYAYITKRIDRKISKDNVQLIAMEDFCQLDLRLTQDKYKGSYERCAKIVDKYSSRQGLDMTELYLRIVFSYVVGNSDMHLKNFSLIETEEGSGEYILSPAYDLLPVNLIMLEDKEQFALTMNGKKQNIRRKDFLIYAEKCGMSKVSAEKMIESIVKKKDKFINMCMESLLPEHLKNEFVELLEKRISVLEK